MLSPKGHPEARAQLARNMAMNILAYGELSVTEKKDLPRLLAEQYAIFRKSEKINTLKAHLSNITVGMQLAPLPLFVVGGGMTRYKDARRQEAQTARKQAEVVKEAGAGKEIAKDFVGALDLYNKQLQADGLPEAAKLTSLQKEGYSVVRLPYPLIDWLGTKAGGLYLDQEIIPHLMHDETDQAIYVPAEVSSSLVQAIVATGAGEYTLHIDNALAKPETTYKLTKSAALTDARLAGSLPKDAS